MAKKFAEILAKFGGPDLTDLFVNLNDLDQVTTALARNEKEQTEDYIKNMEYEIR